MNILDAILDAQGGTTARQAGAAVGLSAEDTQSALSALVPALAAGLHRNATRAGGLDALVGALTGGGHGRYLDNPSLAAAGPTVQDGNSILGHVFGSKDVSRQVAAQAATQTGLSADVLRQLLPIAATLVMGSLAKQQMRAAPQAAGAAASGDLFGMLTPMLDRNGDGSVMDDVLGSVGRMFGGR